MSQLLDALRRAGRLPASRSGAAGRRASAGDILATMGYGASGHRMRRAWRLALAVLCGLALVGGAWAMYLTIRAAGPSRPHLEQASVTPGRSPGPAPQPLASGPAQAPDRSAGPLRDREPADVAVQEPPAAPLTATRRPRGQAAEFARALELQRAGDDDAAARIYRGLLQSDLAAAAHNNLGLIRQGRGELADAAREFETAIAAWPGYARAHNNLGVVLLARGETLEAMERFKAAAKLDPRDPDPLINLALAQKSAGRAEHARESLLRALGLAPRNPAAHYNLAVLYDQVGEPGRAADHYRSFLEYSGAEHAARAADVRARLEALDKTR